MTMRTLLAIFITLGLMLNSGSGFVAAAFAKASLAAKESAEAHRMAPHQTMHARSKEAGDCHKNTSKSPAHGCKCCDQNTKCTHESCACFKCFSVLADVRPIGHTGIAFAALHEPDACDKPPGSEREPPPPPPQS